uniref:DUF4116 domain-containing protein n=1 Tax=Endozoicomonas sp. ONNA1 TaxID=2828740 RepID=UPI0021480FF7
LDCLANPIKLSMSPQRSKLLAETRDNVNRLIHGAEVLLKGYRAFLLLAGDNSPPKVERLLIELPQLEYRFETLKRTIRSGLKSIILPMQAAEGGQLSRRMFRPWVADCHQMQSCLQALNPVEAEKVKSVHELIFVLHKSFVEALAQVALASAQGRVFTKNKITYVDCTTPGEKATLLSSSGKASMEELKLSGTVICMNEAVIVNLKLGVHVGLIELLEHAEGGKGRTLRLTFSDNFDLTYGDKPGKFRRMWFLAQLLKEIGLDKNAGSMKLGCNAVAGKMTVECPRMKSPQTMHDAFEKLIIVLRAMSDLDCDLDGTPIFEGGRWDFNLLAQSLNRDIATEADRFAFQHCLFVKSFLSGTRGLIDPCWRFLKEHHQQFAHHARRLGVCKRSVFLKEKPEDSLWEMLMSDEISEGSRRELLHHFLLLDPKSAISVVEQFYDLGNQCFVINPSYRYGLEFYAPPSPPLGDHKEKVMNTLRKHGLKYASSRVRNDKDFVLPTISEHPGELPYLSDDLRNDIDVIKAAVAKSPKALCYAAERIRSDKNLIESLMAVNIDILIGASKTLLNDREYMLTLIAQNPRVFMFVAFELGSDKAFIEAAKQTNPEVLRYVRF